MRIFLDTNVLASALTTRGLCADLFQAVVNDHQLVLGLPVVEELKVILPRSFKLNTAIVDGYLEVLLDMGVLGSEIASPSIEIPDPDDVPVIGSALGAGAELFVTGDKALLRVGGVDGMPIVSPRSCWELISAR
ncbi:MAG: PIN domain-containing protein [Gammaproteobacteria bacterium]|nr:PIN domain-containing protein [Gammaproteobacteria bacterium]MCP5136151.1 PIN domain-containing protein [Gammaproteobacteria bacterium]